MKLRLHEFLPCSFANGPGARAVVWVQGCHLRCPGCFNPDTHTFSGGQWIEAGALARTILAQSAPIEGVTLTGGEPLAQPEALTEFLSYLRAESNLSVLLFTGYRWAELPALFHHLQPRLASLPRLLGCVDVLIAGRYERQQRLATGLRGSTNKTVHFLTNRYNPQDIEAVPESELILAADGSIFLSGIAPPRLELSSVNLNGGRYD